MAVTIRDVAVAAGVSVGSVSRALKNQRGTSDETRRRIRGVALDMGYDWGRLHVDSPRRLAFLVHRQHSAFATNPFFSYVLHWVEEACRGLGVVPTLLAAGPTDPLRELVRLHQPEMLLAAGYFEVEMIELLDSMDLPLALIDFWMPGRPSVNPDNEHGGYIATRHLLQCGRRRIGFLSGSLAHFSIREREHGYRRALYEAGVLGDPDLEAIAPPGLNVEEGAAAAARRLLQPAKGVDAIFAYNDAAALAAMRVCQALGRRVPEDVAIVGFDDIPASAGALIPLTTIRVDVEALGRTGVDLLIRPGRTEQQITLPVTLIVRGSCGAPPPSEPASRPATRRRTAPAP
ncbi:MAG: LacI family transcriptional regulator [Pseudomonadota bacterium]|nr:LacI family transcriptional regulator [Pseudomonadota bacterium]